MLNNVHLVMMFEIEDGLSQTVGAAQPDVNPKVVLLAGCPYHPIHDISLLQIGLEI